MKTRIKGFGLPKEDSDEEVADNKKLNEVQAEFEDCILRYYNPAVSMRDADTFFTSTEIQEMINQRGVFVAIQNITNLMRGNGYDLYQGEQPLWMLRKK